MRISIVMPDGLCVNTSFRKIARIRNIRKCVQNLWQDQHMVFWLAGNGKLLNVEEQRIGQHLANGSVVYVLTRNPLSKKRTK